MKTKAYQNDLIQIISEQTGQNKEIVAAFIAVQFEEIEKLLLKTSSAKVDGLGVFRVMKTTSNNKVLFIPKFDDLADVSRNIYEERIAENATSSFLEEIESVLHPDNQTEENGLTIDQKEQNNTSNEERKGETTSDPYKTWDDFYSKNKKKSSWGTAILLVVAVALIGIIIATII